MPELRSLTGLRAFAAAWVVAFHMQAVIYTLFPATHTLRHILEPGYAGVDLFFILSGFIIALNYADRVGSWPEYRRYLWRRLARIYPVHLATLLGMLSIALIAQRFGLMTDYFRDNTARDFLSHIFLTHAWGFPTEMTWNVPAWSISSEWLAYLLFPIILLATTRLSSPALKVGAVAVLLIGMPALLTVLPSGPLYVQGVVRIAASFTAGVLLCQLFLAGQGARFLWGHIAAVAAVLVVALGAACVAFGMRAYWITPGFALIIYSLAHDRGWLARVCAHRTALYWGRVSYSLYMTHFIVLMLIDAALPASQFVGANLVVKSAFLLGQVGIVLAVAVGTYHLLEEPARRALVAPPVVRRRRPQRQVSK